MKTLSMVLHHEGRWKRVKFHDDEATILQRSKLEMSGKFQSEKRVTELMKEKSDRVNERVCE